MRVIITKPKALSQTRLEKLLAGITTDDIHAEISFGPPVGKECLDRTETTPETQATSLSKSALRNLIRQPAFPATPSPTSSNIKRDFRSKYSALLMNYIVCTIYVLTHFASNEIQLRPSPI